MAKRDQEGLERPGSFKNPFGMTLKELRAFFIKKRQSKRSSRIIRKPDDVTKGSSRFIN